MLNLMPILLTGGTGSSSIGKFIGALQTTLSNYGAVIVSIIGVAMVIVGIFQLAKNLISHGKGQTNWVVTIALILIGATLAISGGWRFVGNFGNTGATTLNDMAEGKSDSVSGQQDDPFASTGGGGGG